MILHLNRFETIEVDGEEFVLLESQDYEKLSENCSLEGIPIAFPEDAKDLFIKVRDFKELFIGFHRGAPIRGGWWYCALYCHGDQYFRVDIQEQKCKHCSWKGLIANPLSYDLYLGSPDRLAAFEKAKLATNVGCPNCNKKLEASALWASVV